MMDTDSPFIWGSNGAQLTPEQIAARRKAADAMIAAGSDYSPVRSGWQGAARVAQGLMGGLEAGQADRAEKANTDYSNKALADYLASRGGGSTAGTPAASISTAPAVASAPVAAADATGKIYSNDEPSPLDPPSGADKDAIIRTVYGEAGNESPLGQQAVASVIRNRAVDGGYGGDTPTAVVRAPNQFEPWNGGAAKDRMLALSASDPRYQAISKVVDAAYGTGGRAPEDPTEGMTHFYSPAGQAALGRSAPPWAGGESVTIGGHVFNSPDDVKTAAIPSNATPTQGTLPDASAVAQAPVAKVASAMGGLDPRLVQLATDPHISPSVQKISNLILAQQLSQDGKAPISVAKGSSIVDPRTGKVIYKAPDEEDDKPKWSIVGKDQYGQPTYGYPPTRAEAAAAKAAGPAPADGPDLTNVHGKEYMDTLVKADPKYASQVTAIIEGRAPYPTGMLLKTPYGQKLAQDVTQADPSFESGNATARVAVRNDFEKGGVSSPAGQITAGNTAIQHAGEMSDALERMKAHPGMAGVGEAGVPFVSYYANKLHNAAVQGTPEGKDYNDFMTAKNHFSEEVTKFYAGSAGSEAERARALANLDAAKSLPELRSAIKTEANLMQGKVNALQSRWRTGMGPLVPDFPLIQPESQGAIDRVMQRDASSGSAPTVDPDALAEAKRRGLIH